MESYKFWKNQWQQKDWASKSEFLRKMKRFDHIQLQEAMERTNKWNGGSNLPTTVS
jgi:hypothetical protein